MRRQRLAFLVLGLVAVATVAAFPGHAQEVQFGDVVVRKLPELPAGANHGYHEFAFLVTNHSPEAHEVRLEIPDGGGGGGGTHVLRRLAGAAVVGPSSAVRLTLFQPALPLGGNGVRIFLDGRELRERLVLASAHPGESHVYTGSAMAAARRVLVSQRVRTEIFNTTSDPQRYLRAVTAPSAWSDRWLAYSGYDGVVLEARELDEAGGGVRDALWRYVEAGGSLLVLGRPRAAVAGVLASHRTLTQAGLEVTHTGFGVCLVSPDGDPGAAALDRIEEAWRRSREPWTILKNPAAAHRLFSVLPNVRVPVRGIFLVVVAFTFLIGPINLILLHRHERRIWLLWTVPAISLVASAVVFLYAIFSEGLIEVQRSAGLTVLDERTHRAATFGWLGFYSTLTPGGGLEFERHTEVSPILDWSYAGGGGGFRTLDYSPGQHFASGWIAARLPAYFVLRKSETRRERLRLRRAADGTLEAVNGLGADIQTLHLADAEGRLHTSEGRLEAGAAGRLHPTGTTAAGDPTALRKLYRSELPSRLLRLEQEPGAYLRPATYVAQLAENPFLEEGIEGLRDIRLAALVYGVFDAAEMP